jgi:DNA-binding Xre family transcriptional regulator
MDDLALGRIFRRMRIRLGWRAADVAARAGISTSTYSRFERGDLGRTKLSTIRRVGEVLEVRVVPDARWRGAALDRFLAEAHVAMAELVTRMLLGAGWEVRPEVSFNHFGERGVVDLVAWHPATRTALLIELKTELADINELLAVTGRRRRLALVILEPLGWRPDRVAQWVVVAAGRTNQRRLGDHRELLRSAFPADGRSVAGWLANPSAPVSALWFLPDVHGMRRGRGPASPMRVRVRRPSVNQASKSARQPRP